MISNDNELNFLATRVKNLKDNIRTMLYMRKIYVMIMYV